MQSTKSKKLRHVGVFIISISEPTSGLWKEIKKFSTIRRELSRGSRAPRDNEENRRREGKIRGVKCTILSENSPHSENVLGRVHLNTRARWSLQTSGYVAQSSAIYMAKLNFEKPRTRDERVRANCVNVRSCFSERGARGARL